MSVALQITSAMCHSSWYGGTFVVEMKFDQQLNRQKEEREDFGSPSMGRGGPRLMIVWCIRDARAEWPASFWSGDEPTFEYSKRRSFS